MALRRAFVSTLLLSSLIATPTYAFDGAGFGVGMGLGLLGAAIAAGNQPRYYYRQAPRYGYAPRHARRQVAAAPRAPKQGSTGEVKVTTNVPWETRAYSQCSRPNAVASISAKANRGFVKEEYSTRFVCGDPRYLVKQFVYMSPAGYVGDDTIQYFDRGRLVFTDFVSVGDNGRQVGQTVFNATNTQEVTILSVTTCGPSQMQVKASNGFANIRDTQTGGCNGRGEFSKTVTYRAPEGFVGTDTVRIDASGHSPTTISINVAAAYQPRVSSLTPERTYLTGRPASGEKDTSEEAALKSLLDGQPEGPAPMHGVSPEEAALEGMKDPTPPLTGNAAVKALLGTPPKVAPTIKEASISPAAARPDTIPIDDIRGNCRNDACSFFRIQSATKVGSTGNGQLMKADMFKWGATYEDKPNEYENKPLKVGDKVVEENYFFCSKTRPTAFYRLDNQWFSRELRPGDKGDVNNASYDRYVAYWAVCHHRVVEDPYNVAAAPELGYSFAPLTDGTVIEAKKVGDPADILK